MARDTIGKVATDLMPHQLQDSHSAHEQMQENLTDYEKNIWQCVDSCKKDYTGDFYVVVVTKKERLLQNVIRNFFFGRQSCPSPEWDQTLYKYDRKLDVLDFMWVIPSKDTCGYLRENAINLPPEERMLLDFVLDFQDGTLLKRSKELNKESEMGSPVILLP